MFKSVFRAEFQIDYQLLKSSKLVFLVRKWGSGTSLAVQWLGPRACSAEGAGSVPGRGTKIPQASWCRPPAPPKKKRKRGSEGSQGRKSRRLCRPAEAEPGLCKRVRWVRSVCELPRQPRPLPRTAGSAHPARGRQVRAARRTLRPHQFSATARRLVHSVCLVPHCTRGLPVLFSEKALSVAFAVT